VLDDIARTGGTDVVHANYWLSGVAGHEIKHELGLPLVTTFHTLARVKADTGDDEPEHRVDAETEVIACSDVITANSIAEAQQLVRFYDAEPDRIEEVPPGVEHALFSPGDQAGARAAIGLGPGPLLMFVGRIQPLKGLDVAVQALASLDRSDATLLVVGGASGRQGNGEVARITSLIDELGVGPQVRFVDPVPHHLLSTYYRAADVVLAPSRSESFGLVALEAAACGTPVVAAAVGGLRSLVDHGRTGFLVEGRDAAVFGAYANEVLDSPLLAAEMAMNAAEKARGYTWGAMADRLMGIYGRLQDRSLVLCG
ncbi:MAG: glycosyltransferase, partial [Acidimicrobiales bacterium]